MTEPQTAPAPTDGAPIARGPHGGHVLATAAMALVRLYQVTLSPFVGGACRFTPSCSAYAIDAIRIHGAGRGLWLAARRIARCHPWGGFGHDPVPLVHAHAGLDAGAGPPARLAATGDRTRES